MYEEIKYDVSDPLATITLSRPDRLNAWTDRMGQEVKHAFAQAEADENVVVIILTGEGRGFCAGADLGALSSIASGGGGGFGSTEGSLAADPGDASMGPSFRGQYSYPMSIRKPIIAAINGPCAGMAVPISLACDIRFASDRAVFTTAFARRGLIAEWGVSWMLPRIVGTAHALDLLMSARKIDAAEAERIGLVNKVVPNDELLDFSRTYAKDMALNASPASMQIIKREIYQHWTKEYADAESEALRLMTESFNRPDFGEGVKAFMEKRPPKFPRVKT